MRNVLQDNMDFLFIAHTNNDLKNRTKDEKKKNTSMENDTKKPSFGNLLAAEIRSLA